LTVYEILGSQSAEGALPHRIVKAVVNRSGAGQTPAALRVSTGQSA